MTGQTAEKAAEQTAEKVAGGEMAVAEATGAETAEATGAETPRLDGPGGARVWRLLFGLGLGALALAAVLWAQREQGLVRDEIVYMNHGSGYVDWWQALVSGKDVATAEGITRHFGGPRATDNNREHPPLLKTLFGLSERAFHRELGWTGRITAYRLPSAVLNGVLVALVFWFGCGLWGWTAGTVAALLVLLLPRALFHAGLATFDAGMVALWMATLFAYHRALASRAWCLGLGLCFGLALATKHNALMLPGVLGPHYLWVSLRAGSAAGAGGRLARLWRGVRVRPLVLPCLLLGPLVLILLWPWLWFDTGSHVAAWIRFHLKHVHYNFEYLGRNWNAAPYPWHVPVVTTLLTVPVVTLAAAAVGAWVAARRALAGRQALAGGAGSGGDARAPVLLLALSAAVAMGPFLIGAAPIFGAEKHWAPAIPSLCLLAGLGVAWAAARAAQALVAMGLLAAGRARLAHAGIALLLAAAVVAAALAETAAAHPYALSHYNALAGGAPGGADLGMNRQFWGYAARGVLPFLNQHAPGTGQDGKPAAPRPVYTHDASPAWSMYQREGLLAPGLPDAGHEGAGVRRSRFALVIHERHFNRHDYMIWDAYGTVQPAFVLTFQGVPVVSVYARDGR